MLKQKNKTSIVIISYNSEATIEACLESVLNQKTDYAFEVILIDSSSDNTISIVKSKFPQVKLIHSDKRLQPGEARNVGLENAKGDIIMFLASDCIAGESWLENRIKDHLCGFSLVAGAVKNRKSKNLFSWANHIMEYSGQSVSRTKAVIGSKVLYALSYRRDIFQRYGVFPEGLRFGEDTIFNMRLAKSGEKILFDPEVIIYHRGPRHFREFIKHTLEHGRALGFIRRRFKVPVSSVTDNDLLMPFVIFFGRWISILLNNLKWATARQKLHFFLAGPFIILGLSIITIGYINERYS